MDERWYKATMRPSPTLAVRARERERVPALPALLPTLCVALVRPHRRAIGPVRRIQTTKRNDNLLVPMVIDKRQK